MDRRDALKVMGLGLGAVGAALLPGSRALAAMVMQAEDDVFALALDGQPMALARSFTPAPGIDLTQPLGPDGVAKIDTGTSLGVSRAIVPISSSTQLSAWIESLTKGGGASHGVTVTIGDASYATKRRVEMAGCLVKEVSFSKLEAKDGKKHFEVTVEWEAKAVTSSAGGGKIQTSKRAPKPWGSSGFLARIPGLDPAHVVAVQLPTLRFQAPSKGSKRLGTTSSWTMTDLKTEHSSAGFEAVQAMIAKVLADGAISDDEYSDWGVDLLDQAGQLVGTFELGGVRPREAKPPKKGDPSSTVTIDWSLETIRFVPKTGKD